MVLTQVIETGFFFLLFLPEFWPSMYLMIYFFPNQKWYYKIETKSKRLYIAVFCTGYFLKYEVDISLNCVVIAYSSSSTAVIVPTEVVFEMSDLRRDEGSNTHFWLPYKGTRTDWPQRCARIKRPRPFKETQTRRISNTQNFSK